jgi:hypothetical protein
MTAFQAWASEAGQIGNGRNPPSCAARCCVLEGRIWGNLRRPAARVERPLFLDDATFADASRSDGLAPEAVIGWARSCGGSRPNKPSRHSSGIPASRRPLIKVASNKARIFGTP